MGASVDVAPYAPHAAPGRDRAPILLDVLMALSVALAGVLVVDRFLRPDVPRAIAWTYLGVVVAMCGLWLVRRLDPRLRATLPAWWVIAFAVLGSAGLFVGEGFPAWPLFLVSLVMIMLRFPWWTGVTLTLVMVVALGAALGLTGRPWWPDIVSELTASGYLFVFVLMVAWLLAEYARQRSEIGTLLVEVRRGARAASELALARERTQAARDLHDGLGHRLTVITMALQYAQRMQDREPVRSAEQLERAREEATEALAVMRRWVRSVSPAEPTEADLPELVESVADSFRGTGLVVTARVAPSAERLDQVSSSFCHRFLLEGLTNVLRHAGSDRATVHASTVDEWLELSVTDHGTARHHEGPVTAGFGLRALRERAEELHGTVSWTAGPRGWLLSARLPLESGRP